MARPIEATPVLTGKGAKLFAKAAQNPAPYTPPSFDIQKMTAKVQEISKRRASK